MFVNRYGEIRSGWAIAISFSAMFVVETIVGFVAGIILGIRAAMTGDTDLTSALYGINSWYMVLSRVLLIVVLLLLFRWLYHRPVREIGLSKPRWLSQLLYGCLFGIGAIGAVFGILLLTGQAAIVTVDWSVVVTYDYFMYFLLFIAVGFAEEILSRGFMMTALKTTRSKPVIILLPAALFALLHIANDNVSALGLINIFLVGVLFAYMFIRTGQLWMPIGYHITWNFFQGNVFGMAVSGNVTPSIIQTRFTGPDWLTGGDFGAEGGLVVSLITLLGLLFVRFCVRRPETPLWTMENNLPMPIRRAPPANYYGGQPGDAPQQPYYPPQQTGQPDAQQQQLQQQPLLQQQQAPPPEPPQQ